MKTISALAVLFAVAAARLQVQAADLSKGQQVLVSGAWTVVKTVDQMTDEVTCTGLYRAVPDIQLSGNTLYIRMTSTPEAVKLRFDNETAQPMRLASRMEKSLRMVALEGFTFSTAYAATRLRYAVLTVGKSVVEGDLDLTGISAAADYINQKCVATK